MTDGQQDFSDEIDERHRGIDDLLGAIEKLCAQSEKAWRKGSPKAREIRTQQQTMQVLVDAMRQIEIDDAIIFADEHE